MKNPIERINPNLFSSILRWTLGLVFAIAGLLNHAWVAVGFGSLMFITGFFKPRRCTEEGCEIGSPGNTPYKIKTEDPLAKSRDGN